jgi:hypothetical protein
MNSLLLMMQNCAVVCYTAAPHSAAYQNCGCGSEPSAPIDDYILILLFGGLFIILLYDFIKRKNK